MKYMIVLGTRPEIIKMSPIIHSCLSENIDFITLHSGQHYSYNMDQVFFKQLKLPRPKYNLDVGSSTHGEQTGRILTGVEKILQREQPDLVLVEGDTNTTLAGALAAAKIGIKVGHVEAGLRSHDRCMPEEVNRVLVDHCSHLLFAPTEKSRQNLLNEGIKEDSIYVTGNTVVDAVYQSLSIADHEDVLKEYRVEKNKFISVTVHRQENVDNEHRLKNILRGLERVNEKFNLPIIFPIHPRTEKRIEQLGIKLKGIRLTPPLNYLKFLKLEQSAKLVLTDSGGVQEETCILGVPCVTLRDNTERPETLEVGSNVLAGTDPARIMNSVEQMLTRPTNWIQPFGDGRAAEKILKIILENIPCQCS